MKLMDRGVKLERPAHLIKVHALSQVGISFQQAHYDCHGGLVAAETAETWYPFQVQLRWSFCSRERGRQWYSLLERFVQLFNLFIISSFYIVTTIKGNWLKWDKIEI